MVHIQPISAALTSLNTPRHGVPSFAIKPNFVFKDRTVVVLGNSPALNVVDKTLFDKTVTFGVNRLFQVLSPDVYLFTDPPILKTEQAHIKQFEGPILIWQNYEKSFVHDMPNTRFFLLSTVSDPKLWKWPKSLSDPLIRQGTTTAYCIQLAVLCGVKHLGILGIDFSVPEIKSNGRTDTHCYGDGASQGSTGGGGWMPHHDAFYSAIPAWAESFGTKVYNLSPYKNTPIHNAKWPKLSLEEFVTQFPDPIKADQK